MTIREFISSINNQVDGLSIDQFTSPKFIYKQAQSIIADFLKKDVQSNLLIYKLVEGWTEIPCQEMMEVPTISCDVGIACAKLMRSKLQLPEIYSSKTGAIIKTIMSIDFGTEYTNCFSPSNWKAIQNRKDKSGRYFFFLNGYLYIPIVKGNQSSPQKVRIEAYFKDKYEVANYITNSCEECKRDCTKHLDYEMVIPYYLENDLKKELVNQILNSDKRLPDDTYPNNSENNKVNKNQ